MLDTFRKKKCSFCLKSTYESPEKIIFGKDEVEVVFCKKCNEMTSQEKAVIVLSRIMKNYPDMSIEEILSKVTSENE